MSDQRPDPDALLARVQAEEAKQKRGKLKIFFGAAPGVGKTYAMLEAARKVAKEGMDVVVGYIEPHCPAGNPGPGARPGRAAAAGSRLPRARSSGSSISTPRWPCIRNC